MSTDSKDTTFSTPQHRLHNPDEPLPGSLPRERENARDDTERSPHVSYSSSEKPVSSQSCPSVETNVYAPSDDPNSERSSRRGVVTGTDRPQARDTNQSPAFHSGSAYSTEQVDPASEGGVKAEGQTNVYAPGGNSNTERSRVHGKPSDTDRSAASLGRSYNTEQVNPPSEGGVGAGGQTIAYASSGDSNAERGRRHGGISGAGSTPPAQDAVQSAALQGRSAYNTERPLGVEPTSEGGVAIGGRSALPQGHAGLGDKVVGKTQKVVGKATNNAELHEKGELRETGGKAAAEGRARAAHD